MSTGTKQVKHEHSHDLDPGVSSARLFWAMCLNFVITGVEIVGGLASGSLSLLSDALHNFSDGVAIIVSWVALRLSQRPKTERHTFGLKRAQILAAMLNSAVLIAIGLYLLKEAYHRFLAPEPVQGVTMAWVAGIGLVANVLGTLLLREGARLNLNIRSSYLHLLSDAASSAGVIVGGLAVHYLGLFWVDPLLTVLISVYVIWESFGIVRAATDVLMLSAPADVSVKSVQRTLESLPGVENVHHVHLWCVSERDVHLEAHVEVVDGPVSETAGLVNRIGEILKERFGIGHVTVQLESGRCDSANLLGPEPMAPQHPAGAAPRELEDQTAETMPTRSCKP